MSHKNSTCQYGRASRATLASSVKARIALDESELAARWGLSVKTLRRWRQEQLGPAVVSEIDVRGRVVLHVVSEDGRLYVME